VTWTAVRRSKRGRTNKQRRGCAEDQHSKASLPHASPRSVDPEHKRFTSSGFHAAPDLTPQAEPPLPTPRTEGTGSRFRTGADCLPGRHAEKAPDHLPQLGLLHQPCQVRAQMGPARAGVPAPPPTSDSDPTTRVGRWPTSGQASTDAAPQAGMRRTLCESCRSCGDPPVGAGFAGRPGRAERANNLLRGDPIDIA
jgi:hypothetical protein